VKRQMKAMEASIKDPKVIEELDKEMQCCIDNNFIEPVSKKGEDSGNGFYMVWFPVVKMARESTKVRIVYNCTQKFGLQKVSINDMMHTDPKLQNEIVDILLGWREHEYAIGADISKMFLRFRLADQDKQYVHLYYKGKPYQFTRWPFGIRASPFAANWGLEQVMKGASAETKTYIERAIYVDDFLLSTPDKETAKRVLKKTRSLLEAADLPLGKMFASSEDILEGVPEELKADTMKITDKENHLALGMKWNYKKDTITYDNVDVKAPILGQKVNGSLDSLGIRPTRPHRPSHVRRQTGCTSDIQTTKRLKNRVGHTANTNTSPRRRKNHQVMGKLEGRTDATFKNRHPTMPCKRLPNQQTNDGIYRRIIPSIRYHILYETHICRQNHDNIDRQQSQTGPTDGQIDPRNGTTGSMARSTSRQQIRKIISN
jgi:hypothetical protein